MYEDVIQKLKDQMSCLVESLEHEPKEWGNEVNSCNIWRFYVLYSGIGHPVV
jgi:hypothetical protein